MRVLYSSIFMMLLSFVVVDSVNARMKTPSTGNIRHRYLKQPKSVTLGGGGGGGTDPNQGGGGGGGGTDPNQGGGGLPQPACAGELKFTELEKKYVCTLSPPDVETLRAYKNDLEYSLKEGKELYLFAYCGGELESVAEYIIDTFKAIAEIVGKMMPHAQVLQSNSYDFQALADASQLFVEGGQLWLEMVDLINPLLSDSNRIEVSPPGTGRTKCE